MLIKNLEAASAIKNQPLILLHLLSFHCSHNKNHFLINFSLVMILPLFKLGTLALKTFCKPIGKNIKKQAGLHPKFRQSIINFAQANHRFTTNLQRRIYGHSTDVVIRPLNEEKAVQVAADLVGELFLYTVACVAVIFEVQRSARSEARKEETRKQELEVLKQRDDVLAQEIEQLKYRLTNLEHIANERNISSILTLTLRK